MFVFRRSFMSVQIQRATAYRENFYYPDLWESREKAEREKQAELDLEMERSQVRFPLYGRALFLQLENTKIGVGLRNRPCLLGRFAT